MRAQLTTFTEENLNNDDSLSSVRCGTDRQCLVVISTGRHEHIGESEESYLDNQDAQIFDSAYKRTPARSIEIRWVYEPHDQHPEHYRATCARHAFITWIASDGLSSAHTPIEVQAHCKVVRSATRFFTAPEAPTGELEPTSG